MALLLTIYLTGVIITGFVLGRSLYKFLNNPKDHEIQMIKWLAPQLVALVTTLFVVVFSVTWPVSFWLTIMFKMSNGEDPAKLKG